MRTALTFFCVMMMSVSQAQQGVSKTTRVYNEEGKLQMLITYSPSCSCRTYTEYYSNGKIYAKRVFKVVDKGEFIDGEDLTFHPDSSIKAYKLWKNALPEGRAYTTYDNGSVEYEEFYEGKYKTGTWKHFDRNGALLKEQLFTGKNNSWNSKKDDVTIKYYKAGRLLYTEVLKDGKLVSTDKKQIKVISKTPPAHNPEMVDGKKLFAAKCAACHSMEKDGYGPSLKDITRRRSNEWLKQMIANGMKLVEAGDKDAVAIYNRYGQKKHMNMEYLTAKQVAAIIDYLKKSD